ncbi:hypothetical protein [Paramagnetospirillum magneticum]|uniref:Uncharacterized protein n=1 Tax=Paramagnetospirillum magneticum (strain ATCC 700264 / AMB-1) TaxID=342108 RepID=Q2VYJ5_PARM1|nr:hypothetical protein [Paramagnetospirillum magneticum]BAE53330.1 hypothetical protein amb4526 [Paramagnetospirillum magneticum AMB-1]
MNEPVRESGFLCVTDIQGIRHAVRLSSISALRDADEDRTEAMIVIHGGREAILVAHDLDQVFTEITRL